MEGSDELKRRIRARGLPENVATIAERGGAVLHRCLWYRLQAVSPAVDGPAWTVVAASGRSDLVPLWTCETTTVFSSADGSFLEWDAAEDRPWSVRSDFTAVVRCLLTDLWEDEVDDDDRAEVARLLLPANRIAEALVPEER